MLALARRIVATFTLATLLAVAMGTAPAAAHGAFVDAHDQQMWGCQRVAGGVSVFFKTARLYSDDGYAYIAYQLFGAPGFGTATYGWSGWNHWNGSYWHAATTGGHPSHWNFGYNRWTQDMALFAPRENTSSFGHRWWIYTYVWWPDGHVETYWRDSGCEV